MKEGTDTHRVMAVFKSRDLMFATGIDLERFSGLDVERARLALSALQERDYLKVVTVGQASGFVLTSKGYEALKQIAP
jgi:hypothetical protein